MVQDDQKWQYGAHLKLVGNWGLMLGRLRLVRVHALTVWAPASCCTVAALLEASSRPCNNRNSHDSSSCPTDRRDRLRKLQGFAFANILEVSDRELVHRLLKAHWKQARVTGAQPKNGAHFSARCILYLSYVSHSGQWL